MSASTLRILIALFLVAHGLMHYSLTTVPVPAPGALHTPFMPSWWRSDTDPTWPASRLGLPTPLVRTLGWLLWLAVVAAFSLAGLGLLGIPGLKTLWTGAALAGSAASLALLVLYWHPWLVLGIAINLGVLAAVAAHWPARLFSI